MTLWEASATEWRFFWHLPDLPDLPDLAHHRRTSKAAHLIQPSLFEAAVLAEVEGNKPSRPHLHLLPQGLSVEPQTEG